MNHFIWVGDRCFVDRGSGYGGASNTNVLWYRAPAHTWMTEALPIGNGTLGAMVFGGTDQERLQFNVDSLWTGDDHDTGAYQAFGDVLIDLGHTNITDYRRELDIGRAVQTVLYQSNGIHYERTAFASHPAHVIVWRMTADKAGSCSGRIRLTDMHKAAVVADGADRLRATGKLENGLEYESQILVMGDGGKISSSPGGVAFDGCNGVTVILSADTNYIPVYEKNWRGDPPHAAIARRIDDATARGFDKLLAEHVEDYQSLFNRFRLDLGTTAADVAALPTDERLARYADQHSADPELDALFCQYGRYLLISSSRGGLPANLQGLWNESNTPPWRCDYHSNINVEMNYWPAEPTNLSECAVPFIDYVTSLRQVRAIRTKENYGPRFAGGPCGPRIIFSAERVIFGMRRGALGIRSSFGSTLRLGGIRNIWPIRRIRFSKEVCEFWDDHLKRREDGTWWCRTGGRRSMGPTKMGCRMIRKLFLICLRTTSRRRNALGIDRDYRDRIAGMREKLLKPKIGKWGQLQEWGTEFDVRRRSSIIRPVIVVDVIWVCLPVFPGREISAGEDAGAGGGGEGFADGSGRRRNWMEPAWKISYWSRFLDGDHAYALLRNDDDGGWR